MQLTENVGVRDPVGVPEALPERVDATVLSSVPEFAQALHGPPGGMRFGTFPQFAAENGGFDNCLSSRNESFADLGVRTCECFVDDDHGIAEFDGINPARGNHLRQRAGLEKPAEQIR